MRYTPSGMTTNYGDEESFVRSHALLVVCKNLLLDAALEIKGYSCLTCEMKRIAREIDYLIDVVDEKYGIPKKGTVP